MPLDRRLIFHVGALLLASLVLAHGDDTESMGMEMHASSISMTNVEHDSSSQTFFHLSAHPRWIYGHLVLMVLAWVVALPPAIMLSVARSRYRLPAQAVFHLLNGLAIFCGVVYRRSTPDLYPSNSHNPIGWVVMSATVTWTLMSVFVSYNDHANKAWGDQASAHRRVAAFDHEPYRDRFSRDSGHDGAQSPASLLGSRNVSDESVHQKHEAASPAGDDSDSGLDHEEAANHHATGESERHGFLGGRVDRFVMRNVARIASQRTVKVLRISQIVLEKLLLLLGFLAISTGGVVWVGLFRDREVFSGLAHFIKGAIFFWYGLLTLGRFLGSFGEFGWAWNIRPTYPAVARWKSRIPSAEFVESLVIWTYGASNVFMEHMNNWGKAWSPQDLEHVSITLLFFGGGLLGMLIESRWLRDLANLSVPDQEADDVESRRALGPETIPKSSPGTRRSARRGYGISLNPMPALTIMLLGSIMSSHHQTSMVSTMMHKSWGQLFTGFAICRVLTYVTLYIRPPPDRLPSRPPTELIAAFCLCAGGLLFMLSAHDSVEAMEAAELDAMAVFTTVSGLAGVLMGWQLICFGIKGWAVRRERASRAASLA